MENTRVGRASPDNQREPNCNKPFKTLFHELAHVVLGISKTSH